MSVSISEPRTSAATCTEPLRVDQVLDGRHKFVFATPHVVNVNHDGGTLRVALPDHCPACEFVVASVADDLLFLLGDRKPDFDSGSVGGVLVVARLRDDGVYETELWHETSSAFAARAGLDSAF